MVTAVYRPRQDDILLLDADGTPLCAISRADARETARAILKAADTPAFARMLSRLAPEPGRKENA